MSLVSGFCCSQLYVGYVSGFWGLHVFVCPFTIFVHVVNPSLLCRVAMSSLLRMMRLMKMELLVFAKMNFSHALRNTRANVEFLFCFWQRILERESHWPMNLWCVFYFCTDVGRRTRTKEKFCHPTLELLVFDSLPTLRRSFSIFELLAAYFSRRSRNFCLPPYPAPPPDMQFLGRKV